jgi:hypothetical protein
MRRGLTPADLGDLFELPLAVVLSMTLPTGAVLSRPIWHRFIDGQFRFQFPDGDRKIALLERDPSVTALLAENAFPYRGIEVRGRLRMTRVGYRELGADICRRYVEAYDPKAAVEDYLSPEPGVIALLEPTVTTCWDYADDAMMPPPSG